MPNKCKQNAFTRYQKYDTVLYAEVCADRIAAIPGDCKSPTHWVSLVRVQLGAQKKHLTKVFFVPHSSVIMSTMRYCYLNGDIIPESEAKVSIFDIGMLRGFGIYEALTTLNGKVFMCDDHLARFRRSAQFLDIPVPVSDEEIVRIMYELVEKNGFVRTNIKFILTGGEAIGGIDYDRSTPTFYIFTEEWKPIDEKYYTHGASVLLKEHLREYPEYKTINYISAVPLQKKMKEAHALETLYTWRRQILECATSNFFVVAGGKILTPKDSILYGVTRKVVIDLARAQGLEVLECNVSLEELYDADECFISSSFKDVVPVVKVGDTVIGTGNVGPVTKQVMELFENNSRKY